MEKFIEVIYPEDTPEKRVRKFYPTFKAAAIDNDLIQSIEKDRKLYNRYGKHLRLKRTVKVNNLIFNRLFFEKTT